MFAAPESTPTDAISRNATLQPHGNRALALPEGGRHLPGERGADELVRRRHRDAGARQRVAVELDLELRHSGVAVQAQINHAAHLGDLLARLLERVAHHLGLVLTLGVSTRLGTE